MSAAASPVTWKRWKSYEVPPDVGRLFVGPFTCEKAGRVLIVRTCDPATIASTAAAAPVRIKQAVNICRFPVLPCLRTSDPGWYGPQAGDMKSTADLARRGWQEGAKRAAEMAARINRACGPVVVAGRARRVRMDYTGAAPDVGRYLSTGGDPRCMRRRRMLRTSHGRILRIGVGLSASLNVGASILAARAVILTAMVRRLEALGLSIDLVGLNCSRGQAVSIIAVPLKRPRQVVVDSVLAFRAGHPAMLRRVCLAVCDALGLTSNRYLGINYGVPAPLPDDARRRLGLDLYLPAPQAGGPGSVTWRDPTPEELRSFWQLMLSAAGIDARAA